ncbi:Hypothetical predicted protein [Lynx pardinus]|uniref:Uncharacterized protein n=1 Tax=Lynx pardinus TaxID=191816 RepID=A0A485N1W8_LYNPA|nr:Hypothetical predicted protein [Lynx pardinus]
MRSFVAFKGNTLVTLASLPSSFCTCLSAVTAALPYLTQLLSPARTTLDTRKTKDRSAFHSQPLEDRRIGFTLARHQGFLWSLSGQRGSFSVTVPCHYFDHEPLTADERSQGRPTPRGESSPTLALTLLLEESKVGTVNIDFL